MNNITGSEASSTGNIERPPAGERAEGGQPRILQGCVGAVAFGEALVASGGASVVRSMVSVGGPVC